MKLNWCNLFVVVLLVTWAALDWSQRLTFEALTANGVRETNTHRVSVFTPLSEDVAENILGIYNIKGEVERQTPKPVTLSESFQNSQEGDLDSLFAGEYQITLKAIFKRQNYKIILQSKHIESGHDDISTLELNQSVGDYQLRKVTLEQAVFVSSDGRTVTLTLYERLNK
jgi:hypothetical protein